MFFFCIHITADQTQGVPVSCTLMVWNEPELHLSVVTCKQCDKRTVCSVKWVPHGDKSTMITYLHTLSEL